MDSVDHLSVEGRKSIGYDGDQTSWSNRRHVGHIGTSTFNLIKLTLLFCSLAPSPVCEAEPMSTAPDTTLPLAGIRVLAVEQMQSLPYATQLLARLGADVVKVEHPERGDLGRGAQPGVPDRAGEHMGATFLRNNQNKSSIALDLKHPAAKELFLGLVPRFDVIAENFKAGGMDRMGLGYADVCAQHPQAIYLSISGFGASGDSPYGHWPAFAPIAEAMSGLYSINRPQSTPATVSPAGALGDTGTGLFAVIGVLAALRRREQHGLGSHVDIAMFDSMVAFADLVPNYWSLGKDPRTPSMLINDGFSIDAGELVIQVGREHQFARLVELLGHPEWIEDHRFATRQGWRDNLSMLREAVRVWAGDRTTIEAADALAAAGVACAPIFEAADVVDDPHVRARNMLARVTEPSADGSAPAVLTPGNPVKISGVPDQDRTGPPTLGEHTDTVLGDELGLDADTLAELREAGAIR